MTWLAGFGCSTANHTPQQHTPPTTTSFMSFSQFRQHPDGGEARTHGLDFLFFGGVFVSWVCGGGGGWLKGELFCCFGGRLCFCQFFFPSFLFVCFF